MLVVLACPPPPPPPFYIWWGISKKRCQILARRGENDMFNLIASQPYSARIPNF